MWIVHIVYALQSVNPNSEEDNTAYSSIGVLGCQVHVV